MQSLMRALALCTLWVSFTVPSAAAATWTVVPESSRIAFSGTHAGKTFTGTFQKWSADITFDPANLPASKAVVRIDLASASTGDSTYDKTLPTADWFDTARSATAVFETKSFKALEPGRYEADGTLELRGNKVPIRLAFDLKIEGDTARMSARARIARLGFGIGRSSDAGGEWVSLEIPVEIDVVARRGA